MIYQEMVKCMEIRELTIQEMESFYNIHLVKDFPKDEVKPFSRIKDMYEEGNYFGYGLFEGKELRAYAYFVGQLQGEMVLLDYLAVVEEFRFAGYGSKFLQLLGKELSCIDGIILESENDEFAHNEEDKKVRKKRLQFYKRNGLKDTGIRSQVFGVEYIIMYLVCKKEFEKKEVLTSLESIYKDMFWPQFADRYEIKEDEAEL